MYLPPGYSGIRVWPRKGWAESPRKKRKLTFRAGRPGTVTMHGDTTVIWKLPSTQSRWHPADDVSCRHHRMKFKRHSECQQGGKKNCTLASRGWGKRGLKGPRQGGTRAAGTLIAWGREALPEYQGEMTALALFRGYPSKEGVRNTYSQGFIEPRIDSPSRVEVFFFFSIISFD